LLKLDSDDNEQFYINLRSLSNKGMISKLLLDDSKLLVLQSDKLFMLSLKDKHFYKVILQNE
jgi:hypothetical protein